MSGVRERLVAIAAGIEDQGLGSDLIAAGIATVAENGSKVDLKYPYPAASVAAEVSEEIRRQAQAAGLKPPEIGISFNITRKLAQGGTRPIAGVRNVIAISSAKGGVGKSTIAVNLALALAAEGAKAGLLDADIHGPSLPILLGSGKPEADEKDRIVPLRLRGIQALSMGHLIDEGQPVIWRGPMVIKALDQLLRAAAWEDLDYLVLDLPPGTGDIPLSIAQKTPIAAAAIVTTPHALSLADAVRGLKMFAKVSVPVIGFIENMSSFTCPDCGSRHNLFGTGAREILAGEHQLECLACLPFYPGLAVAGNLAESANQEDGIGKDFRLLATRMGCLLAQRPNDRGGNIPPVIVR